MDAIQILRTHDYNPLECMDAYGDSINPKWPGCVVFTLDGALTKALIDYDDKQPVANDNHVERCDAVERAVALALPPAWEPEDESSQYMLTTVHRRQRAFYMILFYGREHGKDKVINLLLRSISNLPI